MPKRWLMYFPPIAQALECRHRASLLISAAPVMGPMSRPSDNLGRFVPGIRDRSVAPTDGRFAPEAAIKKTNVRDVRFSPGSKNASLTALGQLRAKADIIR